jgi:hypothetical protein
LNLIEACEYAVARAEKPDAPTKRDAHAPKNTSGKTRKETLVPSKRVAGGQDIGEDTRGADQPEVTYRESVNSPVKVTTCSIVDQEETSAQYIVVNETADLTKSGSPQYKQKRGKEVLRASSNTDLNSDRGHAGTMSWFDEVRRAEGSPKETASLLDLQWYHDHWSCSDYLSVPASETEIQEEAEGSEEIEVSVLIYEVDDNYVFSDDQYAEVLCGLQDRAGEDTS